MNGEVARKRTIASGKYSMKKFIRDLWLVYVERHKALKATRLLAKQEWSIEFLVMLMNKAAELKKANCRLVLKNKVGEVIEIFCDEKVEKGSLPRTQAQFDALDDQTKLEALLDLAELRGLMK